MIPRGVEVFVSLAPIDLRWSFDRLAGAVEAHLGRSPRSEALFVFFGKRRTALKILFYDGTGLCLFYKRLDRGTFRLPEPPPGAESMVVEERVLDDLLDGVVVEPRQPRSARKKAELVH
jgi:transposase